MFATRALSASRRAAPAAPQDCCAGEPLDHLYRLRAALLATLSGSDACVRRRRVLRRLSRSVLIAGTAAVLLPSAAHAGSYSVWSCKNPDGSAAATEGWRATGGSYVFSNPTNGCSSGGAMTASLTGDHDQSVGAIMSWAYSPPANTQLQRFYAVRSISTVAQGQINQNAGTLITWPSDYITDAHDNCFANWGCTSASGGFDSGNDLNNPGTVYFSAVCGGQPGWSCPARGGDPMARISVSQFRADVLDNDPPDIKSATGTLITAGTKAGTKSVSLKATDVGGGIYRAFIDVRKHGDSTYTNVKTVTLDANDGKCAPAPGAGGVYDFNHAVPCKLSTSGDIDVDTTQLPDGDSDLRIVVEDAAGNRTTAYGPQTLTVKNAPTATQAPTVTPPSTIGAGDELTCESGAYTPTPDKFAYQWLVAGVAIDGATARKYTVRGADVGKSIVCRVTASYKGHDTVTDTPPVGGPGQPGGPPTPTTTTSSPTATTTPNVPTTPNGTGPTNSGPGSGTSTVPGISSNTANGSGGTAATGRFSAASRSTKRLAWGQTITLSGRLVDNSGTPIRGAILDVLQKVRVSNARITKIATVTTDTDGHYSYKARKGVSRTMRFAYRATLGSDSYVDTADVVLNVRGKLGLKASRSHLPGRGRLTLLGHLIGGHVPHSGALIEVQAKDGRTWRTIRVVRATAKGTMKWRYHFKTDHGAFLFRLLMRPQTDVPLRGASSKQIKVTIG